MPVSIEEHLARGPATSKEIQAATGLGQTAVSRLIRRMGDRMVKFQKGRSPQYAMTKNAFGGNDKLPLHMIDAQGDNRVIAYIRPLTQGGYFIEALKH